MSEWIDIQLGEVADIKGGKRLPRGSMLTTAKTAHPYIRVTDISDNKVDLSGLLFVEPEVQKVIKRYTVDANDIILSIVGTIGLVAMVPYELDGANLTENCVKFHLDKTRIDTKYLYHYLKSRLGQEEIESLIVGSTQPKFPLYNIKKVKIRLPELEEQESIAEVLSSLDDKIDLLHRNNHTLEQMAENLFRQWFVDKQDSGWKAISISKIGKVITGKTPNTKVSDYWGDGIPFITPTDFKNFGKYVTSYERQLTDRGVSSVKNSLLPKGSILVTCIGSDMGKVAISIEHCLTNQQINSIILSDKFYYPEFFYMYLKHIYPLLKNMAMGGTTMPIINKGDFESLEIILPPDKMLQDFESTTSPFSNKIFNNNKQILTLTQLRESLLPKLMNGEVAVK